MKLLASAALVACAAAGAMGSGSQWYNYMPAGLATVAEGDLQLKQAVEYAIAKSLSDGSWTSSVGQESSFIRLESCPPNAKLYPLPTQPVGALAKVLISGGVTFGYVASGNNPVYTSSGKNWDSCVSGSSCLYQQWANAVANNLNLAYNRRSVQLTNLMGFQTMSDAVAALYAGDIDVLFGDANPTAAFNVTNGGYALTQSQCFSFATVAPIYVSSTQTTYRSTEDLLSAIKAVVNKAKALVTLPVIGTLTQDAAVAFGVLGLATPAAVSAGVTMSNSIKTFSTTTELLTALAAGSVNAAYMGNHYAASTSGVPANTIALTTANTAVAWTSMTTYFRAPLVQGATADPSFASTAPLGYPLPATADPATLGDQQLKFAIMAASNRVIRNGQWSSSWSPANQDWVPSWSTSGATGFAYAPLETCAGDPALFPFPPKSQAAGALLNTLNTGILRMGYYKGAALVAVNGQTIMVADSTVTTGTGMAATYSTAIAAAMSAEYGVPINIVYTIFSSPDTLFSGLAAGQVDVASPSMLTGGEWMGAVRTASFDANPCGSYVANTFMFARSTENRFRDVQQLLAYLAAGNKVTVGAPTLAAQTSAQSFLGANANVIVISDPTALFNALIGTQTIDLAFRSAPPTTVRNSIIAMAGLSASAYTFFTRAPKLTSNNSMPTLPYTTDMTLVVTPPVVEARPALIGLAIATAVLSILITIMAVPLIGKLPFRAAKAGRV